MLKNMSFKTKFNIKNQVKKVESEIIELTILRFLILSYKLNGLHYTLR